MKSPVSLFLCLLRSSLQALAAASCLVVPVQTVSAVADTTPPTIEITGTYTKPQGGNSVFVTVYLEAADNVGLAVPEGGLQFRGRLNGGSWDPWTRLSYDPEVPFTIGVNCTHFDLQFRAEDRAGNFSAPVTRSFSAPYANNPPPASLLPQFLGPIVLSAASTGTVVELLASMDFDGDGNNDLLNATSDGVVSIRLNPGGAATTFPAEMLLNTAAPLTGLAAGKISPATAGTTNDALPDLAVVANGVVHLYVNQWNDTTHTLTFQEQGTGFSVPGVTLTNVAVGDVNGDGFDDIVATGNGTDPVLGPVGIVAYFLNTGVAGQGKINPTATTVIAGVTASALTLADVDLDDKLDVIVADTPNSQITVIKNLAVGGSQTIATTYRPLSVAVGDFTRDGKPDIAAFGSSYDSAQNHSEIGMSLLRGHGDGTFETIPGDYHFYGVTGTDFSHGGNLVLADVTDDGHEEILTTLYYGGVAYVQRITPIYDDTNTLSMRYDGFVALPASATADTTQPIRVAVGDLNGDGKPDLVVGRESSTSALNLYFNVFEGAGGVDLVPTGDFVFQFPSGITDLTSIFDISGNYTGVTPTKNHRPYDIDVAVDSAGKIDILGTIEGIQQQTSTIRNLARNPADASVAAATTPGLNMSVGMLTTKRGNSVAIVRGKFQGTRDGVNVKASGDFQGPVQLTDLGSGDQGVVGQGSFKANIGGIPSKSSHVMVPLTVPPSQAENLKNSWGFTLTVGKKTAAKNGKISYVASGQLHLPGGDTVKFSDKPVKYTKRQGYTVTFKKGQNITLAPPATDKKSTIAIKKLTLARQSNGTWSPTGGRITYQFIGQKGSGDILSFLPTP